MSIHYLKCINPYYSDMLAGKKTFDVRLNDRDFAVADVLVLQEYDHFTGAYSGREHTAIVTYVFSFADYVTTYDVPKIAAYDQKECPFAIECDHDLVVLGLK